MSRFIVGFVVGAAVGAAAIIATTPREDEEPPRSPTDTLGLMQQRLRIHMRRAFDAGRTAATDTEQAMWSEFRQRMEKKEQSPEPPPPPPPERPFPERQPPGRQLPDPYDR
jgi:gas vesicle protein